MGQDMKDFLNMMRNHIVNELSLGRIAMILQERMGPGRLGAPPPPSRK